MTCVGEFDYLHHDTGGAGYAVANAFGDALIARARGGGRDQDHALDTCYLTGGIGWDLEGAGSCASATATPPAGPSGCRSFAAQITPGSGRRSIRSGRCRRRS